MAASTSGSSQNSRFAARTDLKPYQEKLLAVLKRDEAQLSMTIAGDLPRLAKLITIKDTDKRPMFTLPIEDGDTWTHVRAIIFTLLDLVEQETNKVTVDDFNEYFQIGREIPERMAAFLKRIGGATSNTYRVLSACNQAATAAAVIELKTTLGFTNATTDMANSWRFDIVLSKEYVEVHNMKREQMQKVFEFEWQFVVRFAVAEMEVLDVSLLVTDLVFSQEAPAAQIQDVCQRLDHLMVPALRDDLAKSGCFASEAAKSGALFASSSSSSSALDGNNYVKTGFMRKVGGKRKKPGNWQRRWFALADDGSLYYYKQSPDGTKKRVRPAGCLDLKSSRSVTASDEVTKKMNTFAIDTPDRTYYLQCTTYEECREWVGALSKFLLPSAHVDPSLGLSVSAPPPTSPSKKSSAIMSRRKSGSSTWSKALLPRRPRVNTVFGEEHGSQQVFSECIEGENESIPFPGILLRGSRQPVVSLSVPKEQVTDERVDTSPRDGEAGYPVEISPRVRQELAVKGAATSAARKKFNSLEPRAFSAVRNKHRLSVTIERTSRGSSPTTLEELEFLRTRNLELERLLREEQSRSEQLEEKVASLTAQLQLLATT